MHVGVDLGFHTVKAVCGDRWAHFPSYAVRPAESLFSLNSSQAILVDADPHGPFLIGDHAVKKGKVGARKETAGWITSPEYLALFRGVLSELTRATSATVHLVTGLPIEIATALQNVGLRVECEAGEIVSIELLQRSLGYSEFGERANTHPASLRRVL
jgi:hypothetical protein